MQQLSPHAASLAAREVEGLDADLLAPPWGGRGQNFVLHSLGTSSNLPNPIASSYLSADKIIEKIRIAPNLFIYF